MFLYRYVVWAAQLHRAEEQEALPIPPGPVYAFSIACMENPLHAKDRHKLKVRAADTVPVLQGHKSLLNRAIWPSDLMALAF